MDTPDGSYNGIASGYSICICLLVYADRSGIVFVSVYFRCVLLQCSMGVTYKFYRLINLDDTMSYSSGIIDCANWASGDSLIRKGFRMSEATLLPEGCPFRMTLGNHGFTREQLEQLDALVATSVVAGPFGAMSSTYQYYYVDHPEQLGVEHEWLVKACIDQFFDPGRQAATDNWFAVGRERGQCLPTAEQWPDLERPEIVAEQRDVGHSTLYRIAVAPDLMPEWLATAFRVQVSDGELRGFRILATQSDPQGRPQIIIYTTSPYMRNLFLAACRYYSAQMGIPGPFLVGQDQNSREYYAAIQSHESLEVVRPMWERVRDAFFFELKMV
ncbi:hypothetical protein HGA91_01785 [candidate division WWE3 bacterium]|nr:hypothetical protein [candidate division WWE3 bacterium]